MFYTFHQNNSGGYFTGPHYIIIEASDHHEANKIATLHDVYFDGVTDGIDCECCGDRWHEVNEYSGKEQPEIYGSPAEKYSDNVKIIRKE